MRPRLVVMLLVGALVVGACGQDASATHGRVVVPNLKGKMLGDATCELQQLGLRWRPRGARRASPSPATRCNDPNTGNSMSDLPVTGQSPRPGTKVRRGEAVTLDDICTDLAGQHRACG